MATTKILRWAPALAILGLCSAASLPVLADPGQGVANDKTRQEMMERYGREGMPHGMMGGPGWGGMGMMGGPGWGGMGMMGMMGGFGPGMMRGYPGMMGGYGYGPFGMLQLSDEQRDKLEAIQRDQRKEQLDLMEKMMDEMVKIRDLMMADKRDPSTIGKAYEPVFILQRRMIENSVATMNKMEAVLTKPQREELKKYRHRGMGYGMMGY